MNQNQNLPVEIYEALGETPPAVLFTYTGTEQIQVVDVETYDSEKTGASDRD